MSTDLKPKPEAVAEIPSTREEVEAAYLEDIKDANTARQILAFKLFGDRLVHIGYMQGIREGAAAAREGASLAIQTVFGARK